jgi:hypothetical protein
MFVIHYMCIFIKIKELPSTFMTYSPALAVLMYNILTSHMQKIIQIYRGL